LADPLIPFSFDQLQATDPVAFAFAFLGLILNGSAKTTQPDLGLILNGSAKTTQPELTPGGSADAIVRDPVPVRYKTAR